MSLSYSMTSTDPTPAPPPPDGIAFRHRRYRFGELVDQRGGLAWYDGVCKDSAHECESPVNRSRRWNGRRCSVGPASAGKSTFETAPAFGPASRHRAVRGRQLRLSCYRRSGRRESVGRLGQPGSRRCQSGMDGFCGWPIHSTALHRVATIVESLRPEQVRITPLGQVVLTPDVVLLPVPPPIRFQHAPEACQHSGIAPRRIRRRPRRLVPISAPFFMRWNWAAN